MTRLFQKKNLMILAFSAAALHALLGTLMYFFPVSSLWIVDHAVLGVLTGAMVIHCALQASPPRFDAPQLLLILYMAWYVICCLSMSFKYNSDWVSYNAEPLVNTAVSLLVLFPLGCAVSRHGWVKTGRILLWIILLAWSAFMLFVLVSVFRGAVIPVPSGGAILMKDNSLLLNCNRNTTGAIELVFLLGCCYAACRNRLIVWKVLFGLSALVHYAALVLSNSRTAVFAALPACAAIAGIMVYLALKNKKGAVRLIAALAAGLIAAAAFYLLRGPVFSAYNASVHADKAAVQTQSAGDTAVSAAAAAETAEAVRDLVTNGEINLTGRIPIWRAAFNGLFTSVRTFVFGVTPPSVPSMIDQMRGRTYNMYTHNQFLEIAASTGVPGLILFLSWLALMGRDALRLFLKKKERSPLLLLPVLILSLLLANLTEATLLYYHFLTGYVFFFLCGMLHGAVSDAPAGNKLSRQALRKKSRRKK